MELTCCPMPQSECSIKERHRKTKTGAGRPLRGLSLLRKITGGQAYGASSKDMERFWTQSEGDRFPHPLWHAVYQRKKGAQKFLIQVTEKWPFLEMGCTVQ